MSKRIFLVFIFFASTIAIWSWSRPSKPKKTCEDCMNTYARLHIIGIDEETYDGPGRVEPGPLQHLYADFDDGVKSNLSTTSSRFPYNFDMYSCHFIYKSEIHVSFRAKHVDKDGSFSYRGILYADVKFPKIKCNKRKTKKVKLKYCYHF